MEVCVHLQRAFLPIHCRHVCQQNLAMPVELRPSPVFERGCEIRFCKMRARGLCLSSQLRASRWFMAWECHPATSLCPENPMYSVYSFHLILLHPVIVGVLWIVLVISSRHSSLILKQVCKYNPLPILGKCQGNHIVGCTSYFVIIFDSRIDMKLFLSTNDICRFHSKQWFSDWEG